MDKQKDFLVQLTIWYTDGTVYQTLATMMEAIRLEQANDPTVIKFYVDMPDDS